MTLCHVELRESLAPVAIAAGIVGLVAVLVGLVFWTGPVGMNLLQLVPAAAFSIVIGVLFRRVGRRTGPQQQVRMLTWTLVGVVTLGVIGIWYPLVGRIDPRGVPLVFGVTTAMLGGGALGAVIGRYDVGVRTHAAAKREAVAREREAYALLNQVLRHDIANDLSIAGGHADLLDEYVDEDGSRHIDAIQTATSRMTETVDQVRELTASLSEASDLRRVRLGPVLERQLEHARAAHPEATFEYDGADAGTVLADDLLGPSVTNLLNNAVQHSDRESPVVRIEVTNDGDRTRVTVADDGPGIPPSRREEVFKPGFRGPNSDGTGMGMFLVRTVVSRYGGSVEIADVDPRGTAVVLSLPRTPAGATLG
jgi:signal transduction histidine kinase